MIPPVKLDHALRHCGLEPAWGLVDHRGGTSQQGMRKVIKMCKKAVLRRENKERPNDDFSRTKTTRNRMLGSLSDI